MASVATRHRLQVHEYEVGQFYIYAPVEQLVYAPASVTLTDTLETHIRQSLNGAFFLDKRYVRSSTNWIVPCTDLS
jgi:hypothetical protein